MPPSLAPHVRRITRWRLARLPFAIGITAILALSGGLVYATIPDSGTGVIHGCYNKATGQLKVIDAETGESCKQAETSISWNQEGPQGATGPEGLQGPQGQQGAQGEPGPAGADGTSVLNGTTAPGDSIGTSGDFYLDTSNSVLYGPKDDDGWGDGVSLVGLQGPQGPTGAQGASGPPGPQGATGADGAAGTDGATGPAGPQGPTGPAGPAGSGGLGSSSYHALGNHGDIGALTSGLVTVECPAGEVVLSGGFRHPSTGLQILWSTPGGLVSTGVFTEWRVLAYNSTGSPLRLDVTAICANWD